jgi:PAS domain S-box-containing protein
MGSFPLVVAGQRVGTFNLYAIQPGFFDADEVRLLDELATDISFALEITQREADRHRIEESHARLAMAVEQASEIIFITNPQGTIVYANPAFEKTTGYTCAEAIGQNPRILKSGRQDAEFYRQMWATIKRGQVWHGHFANKRKDGTFFEEEATISPIRDAQGTIINFVSVKRDVTHELELESRFRQAQKMEAIGTLAGGIAHDFNNILAAAFGYAYLLQQDTEGNSAAQESVVEILKSLGRAKDLVQQILTFSRKREQNRQIIPLDTVVKEAARFLRASLPAEIELGVNLATDTPPVLADATQIYQVIVNLGTNALHAMENRPGRLTVTLQSFKPDAAFVHAHPDARPGTFASLTVADTGQGMDANILEHIYEPFFTTKPVGKGTGLGLAVVHGIMKSHEGFITVESKVGEGTTFCLYFPGQTQPVTPTDASHSLLPSGNGQNILLVDDEPAVATSVQRLLARLNYEVTICHNAQGALDLCRQNPTHFDLLITDLTMPDLNGIAIARQVHSLRPNLPILLFSGYAPDLDPESLAAIGIRGRLVKPVALANLATVVKQALAST